MTNAETLTGRTTRRILFSEDGRTSAFGQYFPAGTEVYVTERRNGRGFDIRVPGTLWTQHVYPSAVTSF